MKTLGSITGKNANFRLDLINFDVFYALAETSALISNGLYFTNNCGALLGAEK
jgi:hypothetical protein